MSNVIPIQQAVKTLPHYEKQIESLLGRAYNPAEYTAMLETALKVAVNKDLEPASIFSTVLQVTALKLSPLQQMQEAWLIPYGNRLTLQMGWRGLVKIARRNPDVRNITAVIVRAEDEFSYELGTQPNIHHVPSLEATDAPITHAYSVAFGPDGRAFAFEVLPESKINHIRDTYGQKRNGQITGPWATEYGEMAKKTAVRALCKMLPAPELSMAVAVDDLHSTGRVQEAAQVLGLQYDQPERDWRSELQQACQMDESLGALIQASKLSERGAVALYKEHQGDLEAFQDALSEHIDEL